MGNLTRLRWSKLLPCHHCGRPTIVEGFCPDYACCVKCKEKRDNPPEELSHSGVIKIVGRIMAESLPNKKGLGSHLWFTEVHAGNRRDRESPDLIGFRNDNETTVVEVKVTRSDFLSDKNKKFRNQPEFGMGCFRYYACPEGLISKDELPDKWGLIEVTENQNRRGNSNKYKARVVVWAKKIEERNHAAEQNLLFSLMRRISDFVPVQDLVDYEKLVNQQNAVLMKSKPRGLFNELREKRFDFWDKLVKKIQPMRK